jgi:two-component system NarL family response regulator
MAVPQIEKKAYERLTPRELEVLEHMAAGYTNPVISEKLCISINTTRNHIHNIYIKLNLNNRVQLVLYAIKNGLTQELLLYD